MPITFEDIIQVVINELKQREQVTSYAKQLEAKVKELETKLNETAE
jgi:outer membrane murein-binding lipoprotein Lpp